MGTKSVIVKRMESQTILKSMRAKSVIVKRMESQTI